MLSLFLTFMKIGLFTFGGGYAMIALIEDICVTRKKWITHEEMANIAVIAESTPGPIAINCATFVGWQQRGLAGSVAATLGVVTPSFVILYLISVCFDNFLEIGIVASAFQGIKLAVGLLILNAGLNMLQKMPKKPLQMAILLCAGAVMLLGALTARKISAISLMVIAGTVSLAVWMAGQKGGKA